MTGKAPARLKLTTFLPGRGDAPSQRLLQAAIRQQLPLEETTVAEALKAAGYATGFFGKWHLGGAGFGPREQGFDVAYDGRAVTTPSATEGGKGEYDLTAHAEDFLAAHKDRPFFLYLCHNNPHIPLAAQPERVAAAKGAFNPLYAAVIATLDDAVGRLLAKLDELGLTEKTLVVFTSDNGGLHVPEGVNTPATHNTPFRAGKGFVYEGGLRVPLIVRWPGRVPAGRVVATPVVSMDWMPTLLDLCEVGNAPPGPHDGVSLAGLLRGGDLAPRPLYWHFPHYANQGSRPSGAVRVGNWKLVEHFEDRSAELYDLASDPGETRDRFPFEPDVAEDLRSKLSAWRQAVGAETNALNPDFDPSLHKRLYEDVDVSRLLPAATAAAMRPPLEDWRRLMGDVLRPRPRPPARAARP
jgi:arylsulfatase A-like enzyme